MSDILQRDFIEVAGVRLETARAGAGAGAPLSVLLLHEGLGCIDMWSDFPLRLSRALPNVDVFAYSRAGYGRSDPVGLPRPLDYMEREAQGVVPHVLDAMGAGRVVLIGHSDGASIAAYYAGTVTDPRIAGVVLMSPHFQNEEKCTSGIERARDAYVEGDLRKRLARYHGDNVDVAFWGWNRAWLDPEFWHWNIEHALPGITAPVLILQGDDDPYCGPEHVAAARAKVTAPLEVVMLKGCHHTPFREAAEDTDAAVIGFVGNLLA